MFGCFFNVSNHNSLFIAGNPHTDLSGFIHIVQPIIRAHGTEWLTLADEIEDGKFDVAAIQAKMVQADVIVLHFPLYWYSPPALVKLWLDSILTFGWAFPRKKSMLLGKTLFVSVTTGSSLSSFQPDGTNRSTLSELLLPLERTAEYCGMQWGGIVASQWNAESLDEAALKANAKHHAKQLVENLSEQE